MKVGGYTICEMVQKFLFCCCQREKKKQHGEDSDTESDEEGDKEAHKKPSKVLHA